MSPTLIRYALDTTGTNPDNLVSAEPHTLSDRRNRCVALQHGAFYTEGVIVKDTVSQRILTHGTDYVFAVLYTSLTIKYRKEICDILIIINTQVSPSIEVTYQTVGGDYTKSAEGLIQLLETKSDDEFSRSFFDIRNRPADFVPSPHIHDLGDGYGFEYLVFALEKIRNAIVWGDMAAIDSVYNYVDDFLANLTRLINHRIDTELFAAIIEFRRTFTKKLAGLEFVENLPIATDEDGRNIANIDYQMRTPADNKYIATKALAAFKEVLYNQMVSSNLTSLGKSYGTLGAPLKTALVSMTNGARVMIDSLESVKLANLPYDQEVYPDPGKQRNRWTIVKVSNNQKDRGGILMAFAMDDGVYIGNLKIGVNTTSLTWKKYITSADSERYLQLLLDHIQSPVDPHKTKKIHVGLGDVENLGVATKEDIICRKPVRKYVTYDGMLLFMKAFMTGVKSIDDITADDTTPNAVANYQMIFAPCGPCVGENNYSNVPTPAPTLPAHRPRGELLTAYCVGFTRMGRYSDGFGGSFEEIIETRSRDCGFKGGAEHPPRGTLLEAYCEEVDRIGKYADGVGGYYTRPIMTNSPECGFILQYCPTYEIMQTTSVVGAPPTRIGYGFSFTDIVDPAANVVLKDHTGTELCYIYANPGTGHDIPVRDLNSAIIGYASANLCSDGGV